MNDPEFENNGKIYEGKACQLSKKGTRGKPNASKPLSREEEEILWSTQKRDGSSPTSLIQKIGVLCTQHFAFCSCQEHTTRKIEDFLFCEDRCSQHTIFKVCCSFGIKLRMWNSQFLRFPLIVLRFWLKFGIMKDSNDFFSIGLVLVQWGRNVVIGLLK